MTYLQKERKKKAHQHCVNDHLKNDILPYART